MIIVRGLTDGPPKTGYYSPGRRLCHMDPTPITMDPNPIGPASWSDLGVMLRSLWLAVLFIVLFASNMILGHIMLPSFVTSGHVPAGLSKLRIPLYALAIICFVVAMFFISQAIIHARVLRDIWPDYWI